ncbi:hypothetical protein [Fodinibius sediminis]|nr:hypothetical protein [Fodinibius sediminis]
MEFPKKHINRFFSVGLLLIGAVFFLVSPTAHYEHAVFASGLSSNTEAEVVSNISEDDLDLPVEEQKGDKSNLAELLFSEGEDKKEAETGTKKPVFINQAQTYSLLPAKGRSVDATFYSKRHKLIQGKNLTLFNHLPLFTHHLKFIPLLSGIAINAP